MNFAALRYEELSLNTFPSLHTQVYDGWILRFREDGDWDDSCVLPLYLSTRSYEDKIDFCEKKFAACSLPCAFKMTSNVPSALDQQLEQRGYALMGKTRVLECRADGLTVHLECGEKKQPKPAEEQQAPTQAQPAPAKPQKVKKNVLPDADQI